MELKNQYFKKVLQLFVFFFFVYAIFRLNVTHFFELKENEKESVSEISQKDKILQNSHIGILFENQQKHIAIFLLPEDGWDYDINDFTSKYAGSKQLEGKKLQENTIYLLKIDTNCIDKNSCGQNFENVIELAKQYEMLPKTYDLTQNIILSGGNNGN